MFDLDQLIGNCRACLDEAGTHQAIGETLERVVAQPDEVADHFRPEQGGITLLYQSPELTIIDVVWAPGMKLFPHDHRMWAAIAVYTGREDNEFFRRPTEGTRGLLPSNARTIQTGEVTLLGAETIHSVSNPGTAPTGAIHVYGGDFVNQSRSQWVPPELDEKPYDNDLVAKTFADANAAWPR
jgi:predicted metal-dependent enzyme (double-stranded beta helix superfamily)